jgi:hypothetical protein
MPNPIDLIRPNNEVAQETSILPSGKIFSSSTFNRDPRERAFARYL